MKATRLVALGLVVALGTGVATAQAPYGWGPGPGGPGFGPGAVGPIPRVLLDVQTQTERDVFLVGIRYAGVSPEELKIAPEDGDLLIRVERSTQQQGPQGRRFSAGWMSRRVNLPAGADVSQMTRQDGPGFVTLVIPRRMGGPRW